jgi:predicted DCC family thiol-disulfide oxidoreductase YuxK
MQILELIKRTFSFDHRSIGLYRILIGLLVVADVIYRWEDLGSFYTDMGLIPRATFVSEMSMPWSFSLHLANGSYGFIVGMFMLHLLFGLMLVFGYKSRWAIVGAYLMTVSVHNRNWLVNNGGDDVLRSILFLSMFLPLGKTFSIDSALTKDNQEKKPVFSFWGLAFFFQVFAIYFVSYILKDSDVWRSDYTAFFYSSRLDIFATPLGIWLRDFEFIGKLITVISIYLEWLGPLILIFSFFFGKRWWVVRTMLVFLFIGFHFGIFLTMNIGLFTFICEALWCLFLPAPFWDWLSQKFRALGHDRLKIYYDADCGFCQKGVRILREFFLFDSVDVLPAQGNKSIHGDMEKHHSWVVVNGMEKRFFHFSALLELLRHSPIGWPLLLVFDTKPFRWAGDKLYYWVSHHRPLMGRVTQFLTYREPLKEVRSLKWLSEAAGAFMLTTLVMWNLTTIKKYNVQAPFFQDVTRWLHLYQEWNMFAPYPKRDNIWVEIPAVLSNGSEIELLTGDRDIFSIKDQAFYNYIPNEHWRKFYLNMSDRTDYARYYGAYLCRQWNKSNVRWIPETTLRKFEIIVFSQTNLSDGEKGGISRKLSWKHWCFDEDYRKDNPDKFK